MSTITRTITAAYKIGSEKYRRTEKLTFDPDKPIDKVAARAHLLIHAPHGFIVAVNPDRVGPKGGLTGAAHYYMDRQPFNYHDANFSTFYIATCLMLDIFSQ